MFTFSWIDFLIMRILIFSYTIYPTICNIYFAFLLNISLCFSEVSVRVLFHIFLETLIRARSSIFISNFSQCKYDTGKIAFLNFIFLEFFVRHKINVQRIFIIRQNYFLIKK